MEVNCCPRFSFPLHATCPAALPWAFQGQAGALRVAGGSISFPHPLTEEHGADSSCSLRERRGRALLRAGSCLQLSGCLIAAGATELVTNQLSTSTRRCLKENINILSSELPRCLKEGGGGAAVRARLAKRARALRCCPSIPRPLRVFICRVNKMVANKVRFQRKGLLRAAVK